MAGERSELQALAGALQTAGDAILKVRSRAFSLKRDKSPVTAADLASSKILERELSKTGIPVCSEERRVRAAKEMWFVDPLDGTKNYIEGNPGYCVMAGLLRNGKIVIAGIYVPSTRELYYAELGKGAFLLKGGKRTRLKASGRTRPSLLRVIKSRHHHTATDEAFIKRAGLGRQIGIGSAGLKLCAIASGKAELYVNFDGLWAWDIAGPQLVLEEAGGSVTDATGHALRYPPAGMRFAGGIIALNKANAEILSLAKKHWKEIK
jgi:3'(2'), 5'-bisphosphate nucleotidase